MSQMSSMWFREEKQKFIVSKVLSTATRTLLQFFSSLQIVILRIPAVGHHFCYKNFFGCKISKQMKQIFFLAKKIFSEILEPNNADFGPFEE